MTSVIIFAQFCCSTVLSRQSIIDFLAGKLKDKLKALAAISFRFSFLVQVMPTPCQLMVTLLMITMTGLPSSNPLQKLLLTAKASKRQQGQWTMLSMVFPFPYLVWQLQLEVPLAEVHWAFAASCSASMHSFKCWREQKLFFRSVSLVLFVTEACHEEMRCWIAMAMALAPNLFLNWEQLVFSTWQGHSRKCHSGGCVDIGCSWWVASNFSWMRGDFSTTEQIVHRTVGVLSCFTYSEASYPVSLSE